MQLPNYLVVIRLIFLMQTATIVTSLDTADFSAKLGQVVDNILGTKKFEEYLNQLQSDFVTQAPNGKIFTKLFAEEISKQVKKRADAVRRNKEAIVASFSNDEIHTRPGCCPVEPLNFTVDPRFPGKITKVTCYIGKPPATLAKPTGVSKRTVKAMEDNLKVIPSLKWQYYGNEYGTLYVYPGFSGCGLETYDPRFRPWYGLTATYPKDMVIMIDKSQSMTSHFGSNSRLFFAIKAAKEIIKSLNPNDNIGVIAFADDVQFPDDDCYHQGLALATSANKNKMTDFAVVLQPRHSKANYSHAFTEAFRLLADTGNNNDSVTTNDRRAKVIMLLSSGAQSESESLSDITRVISDGKQLVGQQVVILAFGLNTDADSEGFLTKVSEGPFIALNDPVEETIRQRIGGYYNYFTRPSNDENVVFSVPYNDTGGLGMVTSGCLPIFASGSFQGVTCIDIPLDTLFSPIIDFHLGRLSYAFLVDSRGRVLLHPLLPKLENYKQEPLFIDMESVEISNETPVIKRSMISGVAGNMSIASLKVFPRRGDSPLEGVAFDHQPATYFWHPISVMNASVAIVIVGDEKNISLSWTTNFPPVLLTDEVNVGDDQTHSKCNNFGRVAIRDESAVKFSLMSVQNPYFYREQGITSNLNIVKSYLEGDTDRQGSLSVKAGVREAIAMTYELERIWKQSNSLDIGQLNVLYRYVGTREGVYRVYPAVRVPVKFDPTTEPQYRRSEVQRHRTTLYTQTDGSDYATTSFTKAFTDPSNKVVLGVIGADVMFASFFNFLLHNFDPCKETTHECFAIDRSGFVVIHKDFVKNPPSTAVHITTKEPHIAADLVQRSIMRNNSCVNYADITNQFFWEIEFSHELELKNGHIYTIGSFDLFVIVKYSQSPTGTPACNCSAAREGKSHCEAGQLCQCPCFTDTDYSYCSGHFTITDTTKTCYPATLPLYLPDLTSEERHVARSLSSCLRCSSLHSQQECAMQGCCFSANMACTVCPTTSVTSALLVNATDDTDFFRSKDSIKSFTTANAVDTSTSGSSCDSLCVGLVIGFVLLAVLIAVGIGLFVAWRRGHLPLVDLPSSLPWRYSSAPTSSSNTLNTTVIQVNQYDDGGGYSRPESVIRSSDDPVYLHLDDKSKT